MQSIKVELDGVAGLFIPFSLIVGAILTEIGRASCRERG